jgi:hypothetical protein
LAAARNRADGNNTSVVTVDIIDVNDQIKRPWMEHKSPASPLDLIERIGCGDLINFEVNKSIEKLRHTTDKFDMIFLDGDHSAENIYQEIPLALKCFKGQGLIVLHDYFPKMRPLWPDQEPLAGIFQALDRFRSEGAGFDAVPLGELPWPTKLGTNITSMAVLSKNPF